MHPEKTSNNQETNVEIPVYMIKYDLDLKVVKKNEKSVQALCGDIFTSVKEVKKGKNDYKTASFTVIGQEYIDWLKNNNQKDTVKNQLEYSNSLTDGDKRRLWNSSGIDFFVLPTFLLFSVKNDVDISCNELINDTKVTAEILNLLNNMIGKNGYYTTYEIFPAASIKESFKYAINIGDIYFRTGNHCKKNNYEDTITNTSCKDLFIMPIAIKKRLSQSIVLNDLCSVNFTMEKSSADIKKLSNLLNKDTHNVVLSKNSILTYDEIKAFVHPVETDSVKKLALPKLMRRCRR